MEKDINRLSDDLKAMPGLRLRAGAACRTSWTKAMSAETKKLGEATLAFVKGAAKELGERELVQRAARAGVSPGARGRRQGHQGAGAGGEGDAGGARSRRSAAPRSRRCSRARRTRASMPRPMSCSGWPAHAGRQGAAARRPQRRAVRRRRHGRLDLHAEAEPPRRRQDPRAVDRAVLARHAAAARRQGAVRRPAVRRNGSVGARGVRRRAHAAGNADGQVGRRERPQPACTRRS